MTCEMISVAFGSESLIAYKKALAKCKFATINGGD